MKKIIYIIPGWGESCNETRYKKLATNLEARGFLVNRVKVDWFKSLSDNIFKPENNSILIGFSFGAIIAYLIAKKYQCEKVIFCSISPIHKITFKEIYTDYMEHMDHELSVRNAKDIKSIKVSLNTLNVPYITLSGEYEKINSDYIVPKAKHFISTAYINSISKLL